MSEVFLSVGNAQTIRINRREAARYLGYRGVLAPDAEALFDVCERELRAVAAPRAVWRTSPVQSDEALVTFSFCKVESAALAKNLSGCKKAFVFAATLGAGVDRAMLRLQKTDPAKAAVFDALASAAVEGWCNEVNEALSQGRQTCPRFSPGYGGVALRHQADLLQFLDAQRKLGITLSETFFMSPVKSVTAVIGIRRDEDETH
ncbi:MAG: Vitamin B12 dependent methionine synthase activation subunit [Clostridia bacterium]|nr:Vitamin B12 dependent methionine synthase activation subunit [Clostridia bacterium]